MNVILVDLINAMPPPDRAEAYRLLREAAEKYLPEFAPRLLKAKEVLELTGLSRSALYRLRERGEFPKAAKPTQGTIRWNEADVRAWIGGRK